MADILRRLVPKELILAKARSMGVAETDRALRRLIELEILPARLAVHDRALGHIQWYFPGHALLALAALKRLKDRPLSEIVRTLKPMVKRWGQEREALQARGADGIRSLTIVELIGLHSALKSDWSRVTELAGKAGLPHSRIKELLERASGGRLFDGRDITDLLLILRAAGAVIGNDQDKQSSVATAIQALEHALWAEMIEE